MLTTEGTQIFAPSIGLDEIAVNYQQIFRHLPSCTLVLLPDEQLTVLAMTKSFEEFCGRKADEVVGLSILDCLPETSKNVESLRLALDTRKSEIIPVQRVSQEIENGRFHVQFFTVENAPVLDRQGEVQYLLHTVRDITDWVKNQNLEGVPKSDRLWLLENERENFRSLFKQTPEMVCILFGPEHIFEFVNQAHIAVLGFDATGLKVKQAQPESVEVHGILDDVFRTGVTAELKEIPVTVGRSLRYFNLTYAARRDFNGEINGVMILGSEITEQIATREAIKKAAELSAAANESKTSFVANMSHEIRTPIGVIIGFCELLLEEELPVNEQKEYLQRIIRNAKALTRIIDDILDLAKVEAGKLDIEEGVFSVSELLREVIDSFSERVNDKGIYLNLIENEGVPHWIQSDSLRLRQILVNIIGNAVKFTAKGGVTVTLSHKTDHQGEAYEIEVDDTGIGLNQEQLNRLFKPFVQADNSTTRTFGGTGLGLVISLRLAQALGGDLQVRRFETGKGCTFVISFRDGLASPHKELSTRADVLGLLHDDNLEGLHVLLAEDSPDNQVLVHRILSRSGAQVDIVDNGEDAVRKALHRDAPYDVILMDVQMPRVDGYEATRELRRFGYSKPIIALTAHAMVEELEKTMEVGCNAHLTKPIHAKELVATLKAHALQHRNLIPSRNFN